MNEPYIYHFPDGNASIARMLVRALIPERARQKIGNVVIANSDAVWKPYAHSAIHEAWRAVGELG